MSWLRLATNPGQRAWGLRSCSNVSNTKAVFSGPGKRQPPRWYAFSRPRSVLMLLSLPSMCGKGEPSKRMAQWEYGKDIDYLTHKSIQAHIESFTGSERGTSSQCPVCGHRHKPRGRVWACKVCGFQGHRDVVGSANMHRLAYAQQVTFPRLVTYLRPGPSRRSSRADTPLASRMHVSPVSQWVNHLLQERVLNGTGHTSEVTEKLIPKGGESVTETYRLPGCATAFSRYPRLEDSDSRE